jgi:uncharacterized membrane protein YeaQ/YmgE (transglycosylase-associated protein family)
VIYLVIRLGIGALVGLLAHLITPGKRERSGLWPIALGISAPFFATFLGQAVGWYEPGVGAGLIGTVVAAVFILLIWGLVSSRHSTAGGLIQRVNQQGTDGPIVIVTYRGSQEEATALFQRDAVQLAAKGYYPTSQSWAPGQWGALAFVVALLLCLILIGLIVFIYMLVVRPEGTLTVTYELRAAPAEEKTCPKCAERIKAAALVCHFCGNEFAPKAAQ